MDEPANIHYILLMDCHISAPSVTYKEHSRLLYYGNISSRPSVGRLAIQVRKVIDTFWSRKFRHGINTYQDFTITHHPKDPTLNVA